MKFPVFILAAAVLSACGGRPVSQINLLHEAHNAMSQDTLTANMGALHGSRQWGSASMGDAKHGMDVEIRLDNEPARAFERAYIARGNCTPPAARPWKRLHPVSGGKSKSYVSGPDIGQIKGGRYAIVVVDAKTRTPLSCGNFQI